MIHICYIILAHKNLLNVRKIIDTLSHEGVGFIVHVDKKCSEDTDILSDVPEVTLSDIRYDVQWGDISMIDAVISSVNQAINDNRNTEYFVLLSGECMPVKSANYINSYIETHGLANFMTASSIPSDNCSWLEGGRRRLECYAVRLSSRDIATIEPRSLDYENFRQIVKAILRGRWSSFLHVLRIFFFAPKRTSLQNLQPYGGEFWWRMNRKSLEKILSHYDSNPDIRHQMVYTSNPDEILFNTLVFNLCDNTVNNLLTFVNWGGQKSPDYLTLEDSEKLTNAINNPDVLFVRKVADPQVLDYVRRRLSLSSTK